jgi:hypothetical protein
MVFLARHPRRVFILTAFLLGSASYSEVSAQSGSSVHTTPPPIARAVRRTTGISIDGRLDEGAWAGTTPVAEFRQVRPNEGALATQRTEVRFLFDDGSLYVGARMYDSLGARGVRARLARRDQFLDLDFGGPPSSTSDKFVVILDAYHDHLSRAMFEITASGVRGEALDGGGSGLDAAWDPVWEGASNIDSLGWTAEIRIPYSQLRFTRDTLQTWGLQLIRVVDRLAERSQWAFWRQNEQGGPSRFGHLEGLMIHRRSAHAEALPYVVTQREYQPVTAGDPLNSRATGRYRVGGDLRYHVTSNLTLDAAINPDFGQVEVDPAVVNLSAFETFFPEKRPFFVAGKSAFDFGGIGCILCNDYQGLDLFYSRRIGRAPQLNDYVTGLSPYSTLPENSAILGAVKLTGRTAGGLTVGVMEAVTRTERAKYLADDLVQDRVVEPLTNYFVGRVRKDFRDGATTFGGEVTSTIRSLGDSVLRSELRHHAESGGLDFATFWNDRRYSLLASVAITQVEGDSAAIRRTQEASTHYFQRPDREVTSDGLFSAKYDPTATLMRGYGAYARVAKEAGDWLAEIAHSIRSPGYETNDLGILFSADYRMTYGTIGRRWTQPTKFYRKFEWYAGGDYTTNFDGDRTNTTAGGYVGGELLNYWSLGFATLHKPRGLDDRATRGGPSIRAAGWDFYQIEMGTDNRQRVVVSVQARTIQGVGDDLRQYRLRPNITLKPAGNVLISLSPQYFHASGGSQYVATIADPAATSFFGKRYIFASIDRTDLSLETRVNLTLRPEMTFEMYAQPFFATGGYTGFKEYVRPRSSEQVVYGADAGAVDGHRTVEGTIDRYTIDPDGTGPSKSFDLENPDYNYHSLRGIAVFRYEYRPGSTLFIVWSHDRSDAEPFGTFDLSRDRTALFRTPARNVVQVKLNYWIGG